MHAKKIDIETEVGLIRAKTLVPRQRKTRRGFKISCDFRQQCLIKAPFICEFHSYAEFLYAGLLESDTNVRSFVPQPFTLRIGNTPYTPDFYVYRQELPPLVVELKSKKSQVPKKIRRALKVFFRDAIGGEYRVIPNQKIVNERIKAENWLWICRRLHLGRNLDTAIIEEALMCEWINQPGATLGDLLTPGHATAEMDPFELEIAMLRCLHKGVLQLNMDTDPLHLDMRVSR